MAVWHTVAILRNIFCSTQIYPKPPIQIYSPGPKFCFTPAKISSVIQATVAHVVNSGGIVKTPVPLVWWWWGGVVSVIYGDFKSQCDVRQRSTSPPTEMD